MFNNIILVKLQFMSRKLISVLPERVIGYSHKRTSKCCKLVQKNKRDLFKMLNYLMKKVNRMKSVVQPKQFYLSSNRVKRKKINYTLSHCQAQCLAIKHIKLRSSVNYTYHYEDYMNSIKVVINIIFREGIQRHVEQKSYLNRLKCYPALAQLVFASNTQSS